MCLAIPGQIVALTGDGHLATVEVSKVRRTINVDLLEPPPAPGEWVLIHVGFAMSRIGAEQAAEQLRLLALLGEDAQAMAELDGYEFARGQERREGQERQDGQDAQEGQEMLEQSPARPALPAYPARR